MDGAIMEIPHKFRARQHRLSLDKQTRDALADYSRRLWPLKPASYAAKAWDLTPDEARGVVAGRASQATIDKIFKIGGWPVLFAVMADVVGQTADAYLIETRTAHEAHARRLAALAGDLRTFGAPRHPDPPDGSDALVDGEGAGRRRVGSR